MIYTILADDTPIIVLEATGAEARELIRERWFLSELASVKASGRPLYAKGTTRLRTRPATEGSCSSS